MPRDKDRDRNGPRRLGSGPRHGKPRGGERRDRGHWREHPRSEGAAREARKHRHNDEGRDRGPGPGKRPVRARPAFGGRGPYRESRPPGAGDKTSRSETIAARKPGERVANTRPVRTRPAFGGRGPYRERRPPGAGDKTSRSETVAATKPGERIAKRIARAGLCSRREAEAWIRTGRVAVNGRVIENPALDVTARDLIVVDGEPLPERERTRLFLYHKLRGLVTTHADPEGRPTIFSALPKGLPRLISVGRLDFNTEGLLLLTNDGGLKRVLEMPDTGWLRRYRVRAHGTITQAQLAALRDGLEVDGVRYGPIEAALEQVQGANVWLTFAMREGKNREVRNVLSSLGLDVNRLIRVSYGPFQLGELGEGEVLEVRGRTLRDQLGPRITREAGADFSLPIRQYEEQREAVPRAPEQTGKAGRDAQARGKRSEPRHRAGLIADRKGRRVLVQRFGDENPRDSIKPRRRSRPYKGRRDRKKKED